MVILTWSCMHWSGNFCPPQFGARAVDWLAGQLETLASRNGNSHPCQHHHHQCSLCQMRSFMIFLWGTVHAEEEQSCVVLGMGLGGLTYQPVQQLAKITNFEYRFDIVLSIFVVPNEKCCGCYCCSGSTDFFDRMQVGEMPWWMKIRPTMRILAQVTIQSYHHYRHYFSINHI